MSTLSWNEIKQRAAKFSKEWAGTSSEEADAKSFLDAFFDVFGVTRRKIGTFEHKVKKLNDADGYIDLLWKGVILVEMKSMGKNLDKAFEQAKEYAQGLKSHELPKYILVCDFNTFRLFDSEEQSTTEFTLSELSQYVNLFGFISGYQKKIYKEQDPANIKAAELLGNLHDQLKVIGYTGHSLEVYLVRILFCLFSEDTNIFNKQQFQDYIELRTHEDGSDLAAKIHELFQVLNTPQQKRFKNLDEQLAEFPYVNGKLFEEMLPMASFDSAMRQSILNCCYLDWSKISPAIFGSMFQSVMNPKERRELGAHYTSEKNILKLIKPLFLDELWQEFETIKTNRNKLVLFHKKLGDLTFLDPACGCGNFLIITYRELRLLEMEVLEKLQKGQQVIDLKHLISISVDSFYGIEYEEFPARIAEVAMWLIDHQMNLQFMIRFGEYTPSIPLKKGATIIHANALKLDWNRLDEYGKYQIEANTTNIIQVKEPTNKYDTVNIFTKEINVVKSVPLNKSTSTGKKKYDYILGNPPFLGKSNQGAEQKKDMEKVFSGVKGAGVLDYVCAWYAKAAQLIQNTNTKVAFVSTNSISQGEQVGILWNLLFNHFKIKIHFAHRTFSWSNEAKGNAAVHVVIIGFANYDTDKKLIYEYEDVKGEPHVVEVKNISPYLLEGKDMVIISRKKSICKAPEISFGNMPNDGGNLLLSNQELESISKNDKTFHKYIRRFIGAFEFINGEKKWCLWIIDFNPADINKSTELYHRIRNVKEMREKSTRLATKNLAICPQRFGEIRQPKTNYILIPRVSSENRSIIPMAIFSTNDIVGDTCLAIPEGTLFHLGVLQSKIHMAWVRYICGRLESRYRYSNEIVYNNFPWPENPTDKQKQAVEKAAQKVLDARQEFPDSSLADLYNPLSMPPTLVKAHLELDKAVDLCYRSQPFTTEAKRMEFLFELYEKYTAGLFVKEKKKKLVKK